MLSEFTYYLIILGMNKHWKKALQYVKENKKWSEEEEKVALQRINHYRCGIDFASPSIRDEIHDLMEEYSDDNDLAEGWWLLYGDETEIFYKL